MAVTTGTSVSVINASVAPGQLYAAIPVVQAQDGSFVGVAYTGSESSMVDFDASGNAHWSVPGDQPQIATAGGGVIGQSGITCPSGNGTAARPWYFKLVWQNAFSLYPDNPQYLPNLTVDATSQAAAIRAAALAAFKKAFVQYPVDASEGRANTGDNRANVQNLYSFNQDGESCGLSSGLPGSHDSNVYYLANMEQAQWALPVQLYTAQDVQNALNSVALMKAIGSGVGNNAAHEIGHQFFLAGYGMDDASTSTYNGKGCDGEIAPWVYGFGPISWESLTANAWQSALGGGWHK